MNYITIAPCEALRDVVSHFWSGEWAPQSLAASSTYYMTANSLTEIAFAFRGSDLVFSSVQGHTHRHGQFPAGGFCQLFGVSLYSHAVPFLFHMPAPEVNGHFFSLETLLGNDGKTLIEKIALARSTPERIRILSDYFVSCLRRQRLSDPLIKHAVQFIRQRKGNVNIEALSGHFCLSQKQFERRFKAASGFNPKLFARIVRFEAVLNTYSNYTSLTHAAYANGYYDQAHFINDFKAFAGYSPHKFLALSGY
ncbi:AraC-type DNA-binding protein [Parapedobacter composti]|uniref:AraC-type DNA-binding protein n=1 Tax=Parapedobacter composti TaxID=623281 RepID=A0A1I1FXI0_9SPHI|nr:helix-turn-helix domain-containing protein [Parapedobacter composti]SFC04025.1 AraC-type DNA-binding protein [Parapedobacter composti]